MSLDHEVAYLICTTPRTGSWLLCDVLSQTGLAGYPQEYLMSHTPFERSRGIPRRDDLPDYLHWVRAEATGDNGVCGIKIHWSQLCHLQRILSLDAPGVLAYLAEHLPKLVIVRLSRDDALRQALSYQRAIAEQRWWQLPEDDTATDRDWDPDFGEVTRLRGLLADHAARWADLLREVPWPRLSLTYEQLVGDLPGSVARVLELLGTPRDEALSAADTTRPLLQRQGDLQTELSVHRYLSWLRGSAPADDSPALEAIS